MASKGQEHGPNWVVVAVISLQDLVPRYSNGRGDDEEHLLHCTPSHNLKYFFHYVPKKIKIIYNLKREGSNSWFGL